MLFMKVCGFGRLLRFLEGLIKAEGKKVGFEVELEHVGLYVELTCSDFDVGNSDDDDDELIRLLKFEFRNEHAYSISY